jgi:hypothetical protein
MVMQTHYLVNITSRALILTIVMHVTMLQWKHAFFKA